MRVPMPSPRGTNFAKMFMNLPRNPSGAYDAANGIGGGNADKAKEMRLAVENLLNELHLDEKQVGRILETLDEYAPFDRLDDNDPNAERARGLAGDDDEDDPFAAVKKLLRDKGMNEADITKAIEIARGGGVAKDTLPGMGGALAAKRPAMDAAALASREADMDRQYGTRRIVSEPGRQAADRRTVADDSDAAMARFAKMFPGAERIGHA
jgi:hypothetical protein